ncbi:MAG: hypothetical protein WC717_04220 [Candidatus Micrarchaeia archaeon]|jgi:hypothetical protein
MGKKASQRTQAAAMPEGGGGWRGKLRDSALKFEQYSYAAASRLPSQRIMLWLKGFFRPGETCGRAEKNANFLGVAANLLLFYIAYSLIFFLFMLAFTSLLSAEERLYMGLENSPDLAQIAISSLVAGPVASTLSVLAAFAAVFICARALGGNGAFARQADAMSRVLFGSNTLILASILLAFAISLPAFLLRKSAFLGALAGIAAALASLPLFLLCLAIAIYSIYAYYLVVRKAHNLAPWRAAGAIVAAAAILLAADAALGMLLRG